MRATSPSSPKYQITSLDRKHQKNLFFCGMDALDQYLKIQASQDTRKNVSITYVLTEQGSYVVLGYYTISSIGIFPGELPAELAKKLPRYPVLPGILLGRIAVDNTMKGHNLGAFLLMDAFKRSQAVSQQIGIVAVIVDAKDEIAVGFYKHFGFIPFLGNERRLFLPIGTIKELGLLNRPSAPSSFC